MEILWKTDIRITNKKDYDQSKIFSVLLCMMKLEARKSHKNVKNERLAILPSNNNPLEQWDFLRFRCDGVPTDSRN